MEEGLLSINSQNNRLLADKTKVDKLAKGSTSTVARKKLVDISNLPQQLQASHRKEKSLFLAATSKESIDQLKRENATLMKFLADRNKVIELSGIEIHKLRIKLQKMQQQNLQLAQSNSQMLAELNSDKDRLKALQHELGCKNGLLRAKKLELVEKEKTEACQKIDTALEVSKLEQAPESIEPDRDDTKPSTSNMRQQSKSLSPSTVKQIQAKEKAENKRICVRRQSARFRSEESKPTEDFLKTDEAKFRVCPLLDNQIDEDGSTIASSSVKTEDNGGSSSRGYDAQEFTRSSIGRPLRQAATKVQSYREIPVNVKMRRPE